MQLKNLVTLLPAVLALLVGRTGARAADGPPASSAIPPDQVAALRLVSADSMRGHLSFIASDLLEGRATPSRGLDLAAEYIAAQFRRAGLEPVGDDGYFQTATWPITRADASSFRMEVQTDGTTFRIAPAHVSLGRPRRFDVAGKQGFKVDSLAPGWLAELRREDVEGKVVLLEKPGGRGESRAPQQSADRASTRILGRLLALRAALVVVIDRDPAAATGLRDGPVVDPEARELPSSRTDAGAPASITVHDPRIVALFDGLPVGPVPVRLTLRLAEPAQRPVKMRNVIGLLRGSDPSLEETYVMVSAHYDHLGVGKPVGGDRIYNGANDDGSGTVSVIELASALATLKPRPRRSLVFLTFFGEELGLFGSRYYARHPVFPIARTVADLNLELVGRTDGTDGPQVGSASVTGIDFSDVGAIVTAAGKAEGVRVYKHPINSDDYFNASDNFSLAELGVPAHSVTVSYTNVDYHTPLDHFEKVDYANMARVVRVVGRSMLMIADSADPPRWSATNPGAARYLKAREGR